MEQDSTHQGTPPPTTTTVVGASATAEASAADTGGATTSNIGAADTAAATDDPAATTAKSQKTSKRSRKGKKGKDEQSQEADPPTRLTRSASKAHGEGAQAAATAIAAVTADVDMLDPDEQSEPGLQEEISPEDAEQLLAPSDPQETEESEQEGDSEPGEGEEEEGDGGSDSESGHETEEIPPGSPRDPEPEKEGFGGTKPKRYGAWGTAKLTGPVAAEAAKDPAFRKHAERIEEMMHVLKWEVIPDYPKITTTPFSKDCGHKAVFERMLPNRLFKAFVQPYYTGSDTVKGIWVYYKPGTLFPSEYLVNLGNAEKFLHDLRYLELCPEEFPAHQEGVQFYLPIVRQMVEDAKQGATGDHRLDQYKRARYDGKDPKIRPPGVTFTKPSQRVAVVTTAAGMGPKKPSSHIPGSAEYAASKEAGKGSSGGASSDTAAQLRALEREYKAELETERYRKSPDESIRKSTLMASRWIGRKPADSDPGKPATEHIRFIGGSSTPMDLMFAIGNAWADYCHACGEEQFPEHVCPTQKPSSSQTATTSETHHPKGSLAALRAAREKKKAAEATSETPKITLRCDYEMCTVKSVSHNTEVCPVLHNRCKSCLLRGHYTPHCPIGTIDAIRASELDQEGLDNLDAAFLAFEEAADRGVYTRHRHTYPSCGFFPIVGDSVHDVLMNSPKLEEFLTNVPAGQIVNYIDQLFHSSDAVNTGGAPLVLEDAILKFDEFVNGWMKLLTEARERRLDRCLLAARYLEKAWAIGEQRDPRKFTQVNWDAAWNALAGNAGPLGVELSGLEGTFSSRLNLYGGLQRYPEPKGGARRFPPELKAAIRKTAFATKYLEAEEKTPRPSQPWSKQSGGMIFSSSFGPPPGAEVRLERRTPLPSTSAGAGAAASDSSGPTDQGSSRGKSSKASLPDRDKPAWNIDDAFAAAFMEAAYDCDETYGRKIKARVPVSPQIRAAVAGSNYFQIHARARDAIVCAILKREHRPVVEQPDWETIPLQLRRPADTVNNSAMLEHKTPANTFYKLGGDAGCWYKKVTGNRYMPAAKDEQLPPSEREGGKPIRPKATPKRSRRDSSRGSGGRARKAKR